ncbi:hypothetical protein HYW83_04405 [Candidatus Peregrinibacteria bacterium]|nr:hypothetical protein [Candidatus Peregrinibacteria bacterium]
MKKISLLILTSFISALLFNISTAFAGPEEEKKKLKVYYSESIGAGQKVYHITTCSKSPAWAPLKCIAKSDTEAYFEPAQCVKEGKSLDSEYVQGCLEGDGQYMNVEDATYPLITEEGKQKYLKKDADGGCSDKPEKQGFVYAPELAVVDKSAGADDYAKWKVLGKVVWPLGQTPDANYLKQKFGKDGLSAERTYRPALCVTYDVIAEGEGAGNREAVGELQGRVKTLYNDVEPIGQDLIDAGCNNDNSKESTIFDSAATASCAIQERITGDSGSDVLANYIGAIYRWAAGIVGIVAVLIMVASGIQISAAGGDSAKLDSAKNRILQSIIGLAILFLSGLILYTINPTFFTGG